MNVRLAQRHLFILCVLASAAAPARADEGMWLLNKPPVKALKQAYGFTPTAGWLEHIQKSCVKFGWGGSASLVSANGLVMTNHHVGSGQLYKLSTPGHNLLEEGFYAATRDQELKCKDLELKILWSIEDVTDQVNAAVQPGMSAAEANAARRGRIAAIEKESQEQAGFIGDVVTLYHGARYHLYRYKRYTDIRLVMAPEGDIAHFGGDTDNFEYPRFCLDVSFFRIYENGQPLRPEHYLSWSTSGASDGELTFIVGHPYRTERLFTVENLKFLRDVKFPTILRRLWRREVQLLTFSARSIEQKRMARSEIGHVQNSRKAFTGMIAGLHDPSLVNAKMAAEHALRAAVDANPNYKSKWADAWDEVARAQAVHRALYERYSALEGRRATLKSDLLGMATDLVRLAAELPKPNGERLTEYTDAALDTLYLALYSPAPIYDALEINRIATGLSYLIDSFGADDPLVQTALGGLSPQARAEALVHGTKLRNVETRKRIAQGGARAIAASNDPMIRFAALLDPEKRALRKRYEQQVESVEREAYTKIAAAMFAVNGEGVYPDATGSLRLAYGPVRGYTQGGEKIPPFTNFGGLFKRFDQRHGEQPFDLPKRWLARRDALDPATPFNFVCTADIIGGNSGSPVINRQGELIGIVFDGNIQSLVWDIAYTGGQARAVAVDARGIIQALRHVYEATALADELLGRG